MKNKKIPFVITIALIILITYNTPGFTHAADKNITSKENATIDNTIYNVGSVSKVYVTAAVMQLVDKGQVDLDAPVTDYIKEFKMSDERYKDITVRMLMNHTSGIMGTTAINSFLLDDVTVDREKMVLNSLKNQHLKAAPGEYACYCNDGFDLLMIIVTRVSGMDYDTYLEKNIFKKIGASSVGTSTSLYGSEDITDIYVNGNRFDKEYVMAVGAGGVYSNARDTCEFGSAFFNGDKRLLSEKSKNEMNTLSTDSPYSGYGLGWDKVSLPEYEKEGVKVVTKGGDSLSQHTNLLVAPDEEISVCVTTSGGSSSYNLSMCKALMNIALDEKGIDIKELKAPDVTLKSVVPNEYKQYEGYYTSTESGLMEVSFPDMKYMLVKNIASTTKEMYFKYSDKGFVKVTGDVAQDDLRIDSDYMCLEFQKKDGNSYVISEALPEIDGLLRTGHKTYLAEKLQMNPVSQDVLSIWKERAAKKYVLFSDKYSSFFYTNPFVEVKMLEDTGYIMIISSEGSLVLKITDGNNAVSFTTIPSDANRDIYDIYVDDKGIVSSTRGLKYISLDECEMLTKDITGVDLKSGNAKWYSIDDSIANSDIKGMPDFINPMNFISKMVFIFYKTQFENDGLGCLTFWLLSTFMNICLCGRVFMTS